MRTDNLNASELKDLARRITALERATPLNNASIGRNGLRVHSGGVITIQNGGLSITGTAEVIGALIGSGQLTWTGNVSFTGPVDLEGDVAITKTLDVTAGAVFRSTLNTVGASAFGGTVSIVGALRLRSETTLEDDLTVTSGGKITVGNMKIGEGTHGSGKGISFTNGGAVSANSNSVEVYAASGGLLSVGTGSSALYHGANGVIADGSGVRVSGAGVNTGLTPNVHMDATGRLWRTS